jgi:hypothetical protein
VPRKKRFDDLMEAIAFAEAGETDTARALAREVFPERPPVRRIIAVGGPGGFSRAIVEGCLGMAGRLGYGVVALTVTPAMARLLARLGAGARASRARISAETFRSRAAELRIPFHHAVRTGGPDEVVADASRRFRRVAFLLVEPRIAAKARFTGVDIPIFSLADA